MPAGRKTDLQRKYLEEFMKSFVEDHQKSEQRDLFRPSDAYVNQQGQQ